MKITDKFTTDKNFGVEITDKMGQDDILQTKEKTDSNYWFGLLQMCVQGSKDTNSPIELIYDASLGNIKISPDIFSEIRNH